MLSSFRQVLLADWLTLERLAHCQSLVCKAMTSKITNLAMVRQFSERTNIATVKLQNTFNHFLI